MSIEGRNACSLGPHIDLSTYRTMVFIGDVPQAMSEMSCIPHAHKSIEKMSAQEWIIDDTKNKS